MSDYIERKSIRNLYSCLDPEDKVRGGEQVLIDIDAIPSADAVSREDYEVMQFCFEQMKSLADKLAHNARPQGEWKPFDLTWGRSLYACSVCEEVEYLPCDAFNGKPLFKYCPNCGARMKGADDE